MKPFFKFRPGVYHWVERIKKNDLVNYVLKVLLTSWWQLQANNLFVELNCILLKTLENRDTWIFSFSMILPQVVATKTGNRY